MLGQGTQTHEMRWNGANYLQVSPIDRTIVIDTQPVFTLLESSRSHIYHSEILKEASGASEDELLRKYPFIPLTRSFDIIMQRNLGVETYLVAFHLNGINSYRHF